MSAPNQIVNVGTLAWRYANLCEDGVGSDEDGGGDPEGDAGLGRGEESDVGGEEQLLVHSQPGNDVPMNVLRKEINSFRSYQNPNTTRAQHETALVEVF